MSKGGTVGKILEEQVKKKVANKFGIIRTNTKP